MKNLIQVKTYKLNKMKASFLNINLNFEPKKKISK